MDIIQCKQKQFVESNDQKKFNKLQKKIVHLQHKIKLTHQELDDYLNFYNKELYTLEKRLRDAQINLIKLLYKHYRQTVKLSKKERRNVKNWIVDKIIKLMNVSIDSDLNSILQDLEGIDYKAMAADELSSFKDNLKKMFKDNGIDVDLSNIEFTDSKDEAHAKIIEAMRIAQENLEEEPHAKQSTKSKNQMQHEIQIKELEILQKNGLSIIYKKLAKILHPDLEMDHVKKIEKVEVMKKLSCAYNNNDLHTLLAIETELLNNCDSQEIQQPSEEKIKIYNLLLKKQINQLQTDLEHICFHQKYYQIQHYLINCIDKSVLKKIKRELKFELDSTLSIIDKLSGEEVENTIRNVVLCVQF